MEHSEFQLWPWCNTMFWTHQCQMWHYRFHWYQMWHYFGNGTKWNSITAWQHMCLQGIIYDKCNTIAPSRALIDISLCQTYGDSVGPDMKTFIIQTSMHKSKWERERERKRERERERVLLRVHEQRHDCCNRVTQNPLLPPRGPWISTQLTTDSQLFNLLK